MHVEFVFVSLYRPNGPHDHQDISTLMVKLEHAVHKVFAQKLHTTPMWFKEQTLGELTTQQELAWDMQAVLQHKLSPLLLMQCEHENRSR